MENSKDYAAKFTDKANEFFLYDLIDFFVNYYSPEHAVEELRLIHHKLAVYVSDDKDFQGHYNSREGNLLSFIFELQDVISNMVEKKEKDRGEAGKFIYKIKSHHP